MSQLEEKLENTSSANGGIRAQAYLLKHLTYKDGTPRYRVVDSDMSGPLIIESYTMLGTPLVWRRVYFEGKDCLFERVLDGESTQGYFAPPKETKPKAKRASTRRQKTH